MIYRHPAVLLKVMNTVISGRWPHLSRIGAAGMKTRPGATASYPPTAERFELLEDNLQLAKALWPATRISFEASTRPHRPSPTTARSPRRTRASWWGHRPNKTLRMVAQYADACNIGDWVA